MMPLFDAYDGLEPYVFISYSHRDKLKVHPILLKLHSQGLRIWYDEGIKTGSDWRQEIVKKIRECTTFIVFFSRNSIHSNDVVTECLIATKERKKRYLTVSPVYLEKLELPDNLIYEFINLQADNTYLLGEEFLIKNLIKNLNHELWESPYFSRKMDDMIQIYNALGEPLSIQPRKEIHKNPFWHKTIIIIVVVNNEKILYIKRSGRSRIGPNLFDFFGGHLVDQETFREAAKRELSEELGIPLDSIEEQDLSQIGEEGQFSVRINYPRYKNYEFSTLYLYFLRHDSVELNILEKFGVEKVLLKRYGDFLEDLVNKFHHDPDNFADGLSRVLSQKEIIQQIQQKIKSRQKSLKN